MLLARLHRIIHRHQIQIRMAYLPVLDDGARGVVGGIIHNHNLIIRMRLPGERLEQLRQVLLLIARRDDY